MKVLCLHGTGAHLEFFKSQLSALEQSLGRDDEISFHFLRGVIETSTNPELDPSLTPPFYSYFSGTHVPNPGVAISELSLKSSPEDYSRFFARFYVADSKSVDDACTLIQHAVDDEGPFDGILGFSSGAALAATYLIRQEPTRQPALFRFAVFICGGPGFGTEGARLILADESDRRIVIPSVHVYGSLDPLYKATLALYNTCVGDPRRLIDHGKGHVMPWDRSTTQAIADATLELFRQTSKKC